MNDEFKKLRYFVKLLRPLQWIKNGFIVIPLLFSQKVFHLPSLLTSLQTLIVFCALSSSIYAINDIFDVEADRRHPVKRHRPIAAGFISIRSAVATACILMFVAFVWGGFIGKELLLVLIVFVLIQMLYNFQLKEVPILDIFCVSFGFFLRVISGAVAINVNISHWLIICTALISMFLAVAKRRHELENLGQKEAVNHRKVLSEYSPYLLDQMMTIIAGCTLLSYMLYCISPETIGKFQTDQLVYTIPFVLYGVFRYLYIVQKKILGGAPEKVLISDTPLMLCVVSWAVFCALIIYGVV